MDTRRMCQPWPGRLLNPTPQQVHRHVSNALNVPQLAGHGCRYLVQCCWTAVGPHTHCNSSLAQLTAFALHRRLSTAGGDVPLTSTPACVRSCTPADLSTATAGMDRQGPLPA
jgi:hypothetical protein